MNVIIVDDELHGRENLKILIEKHCPSLNVLGLASNVFEANKLIELHKPNVVFLDVAMGLIDGITYLKSLKERDFQVIIVSAYRDYAMQAMENGAFGYLLKPVLSLTLQEQIKSLENFFQEHSDAINNNKPKNGANNSSGGKIAVTHSNGYLLADITDIIRFEAHGNYTRIHLADGTVLLTSKTLKRYNDQIQSPDFFRIHKTHFVNITFVKEVLNKGNGFVVLKDGTELPIAVLKRPLFNKYMKNKPLD
ncbi:MAG: LytTR family DNA-binding domain-containing protein [Bacteroidota bacterium]|nr:LytTR family DNA-binding domain-containing protein [Bacteroidota bacterium]